MDASAAHEVADRRASDFTDGGALPDSAYQPLNESPELSWDNLLRAVKDIPATLSGLPHNGGPGTALVNDLGGVGCTGANPPAGTGLHRMYICVTTLAVDSLEVAEGASRALLNIALIPHTLGRAIIVGTSTPR